MGVDFVPTDRTTAPTSRFRCAVCSFVTTADIVPACCPTCEGSVWVYEERRPFTRDRGGRATADQAYPLG